MLFFTARTPQQYWCCCCQHYPHFIGNTTLLKFNYQFIHWFWSEKSLKSNFKKGEKKFGEVKFQKICEFWGSCKMRIVNIGVKNVIQMNTFHTGNCTNVIIVQVLPMPKISHFCSRSCYSINFWSTYNSKLRRQLMKWWRASVKLQIRRKRSNFRGAKTD